MNRVLTSATLCLLLTGGAMAETPSKSVAAAEAANLARLKAMERPDPNAMQRLLADDLVYCHSYGKCESKTEYLAALSSPIGTHSVAAQGREVGDVVIINGEVVYHMTTDQKPQDVKLKYTAVWVERNGSWQMTAWQSTRLP
jgi:ketosteroid isomerase-like protein